jgi:hypothetical protein
MAFAETCRASEPGRKPMAEQSPDPPGLEEGIQLVSPSSLLEAGQEAESCVPVAYDFASKVPAQYKDEARNVMFVKSARVRQEPARHHVVVWSTDCGH